MRESDGVLPKMKSLERLGKYGTTIQTGKT